ncbi:FGGY family carbohydrate kinase, partial [Nocardia cyriacigeorgica]
ALGRHGLRASDLAAVGVTNQRETTVVWDRHTGRPHHNAIVWQDTRTEDLVARLAQRPDADEVQVRCGLPVLNYFAA